MSQKLKSFEELCKMRGIKPEDILPDFSSWPEDQRKWARACFTLPYMVAAANELANEGKPWRPDYTDTDQPKYEPWPDIEADKERPSGFGFSATRANYTRTCAGVRLVFKEYDWCNHAQEEWQEIKDYLLFT